MTREEIEQMANTCDSYYSCACCPYNPEDISRFIGDRWKGGCPNYDRKLVYAMGKGYGDVSEYEAEIEILKIQNKNLGIAFDRLEAENERLTERLKQVLLSIDTVKEMNAMCNIDDHRKQAVKEFAEKLKKRIKTAIDAYFNLDGGGYYLAEDAINDIDDLIEEVEKQ